MYVNQEQQHFPADAMKWISQTIAGGVPGLQAMGRWEPVPTGKQPHGMHIMASRALQS